MHTSTRPFCAQDFVCLTKLEAFYSKLKMTAIISRHFQHLVATLFEILGSAFGALALVAFGYVLETTSLQQRFHDDFAAAIGADEFLRGNCRSRVFACSSHFIPPKKIRFRLNYSIEKMRECQARFSIFPRLSWSAAQQKAARTIPQTQKILCIAGVVMT